MNKRIWFLALAGAAALAHAALPPSVLPSPLYLSTVSPHVVLSNTEDPTEISMQVPDTIGAVGTQRLSKDITYTLGSNDWAEASLELVITFVAVGDPT